MRGFWALLVFAGCVATAQKAPDRRVEPALVSIHPFTVSRGEASVVTVRGSGLRAANSVYLKDGPLNITIESAEAEPPSESKRGPMDLVRLRVEVKGDAKPGRYPIRLITPSGLSNALPLHITDLPITPEPTGVHETPDSAVAVAAVPSIFNGRLSRRGEADFYAFNAKAGETVTFEVISGLPQIAAGGSAATIANFDPSLAIYEAGASWFDPKRLKRIAYNDEPLWVFGKSTDAHLIHRFQRDGSYLLRVEAFAGQGGPDYGYQLKVLPGAVPQDSGPAASRDWDERGFGRPLASNRLNQLAARAAAKPDKPSIESYRAMAVPPAEAPLVKLPANIDGTLTQPGETQRARFQLDGPLDIAIEVETPASTAPFFNPIVRLLNASGEEVATNVFAGKGACSGALTKSLQSKTIIPMRESGGYVIEVRDATSDVIGPDARYRIQVRQQIPHLGRIGIEGDHFNLAPEEAKTFRVTFDREEDYRGAVAVMVESLPPGVTAATGADYEPDKDPPLREGKRERYTPRTERTVVVLTAAPDAPATSQPQFARIVVRPVAGGKVGEIIASKSIPVMVISKP
jgi:hypothetical protein